MNYRFSGYEGKNKDYIRLVLKTEDPLLYRAGKAEDYPDVDTVALDRLATAFLAEEKRKASAFGAYMASREGQASRKDAIEARKTDIRMRARELFRKMEESDDPEVLAKLNTAFSELTESARRIEQAFTFQNPWYAYYKGISDPVKAIRMIIVRATITDPGWANFPVYPEDKNYARFGMKGAKAKVEPVRRAHGRGSQNGKRGRPSKPVKPDYVEPALCILSYEPIAWYEEYRDILPHERFSRFLR